MLSDISHFCLLISIWLKIAKKKHNMKSCYNFKFLSKYSFHFLTKNSQDQLSRMKILITFRDIEIFEILLYMYFIENKGF